MKSLAVSLLLSLAAGSSVYGQEATAPGVIDDAVDEVIEEVTAKGGSVVFVDNGALAQHQRVALILRY